MAKARLPKLPPSAARIGQLRKRITRNRRSNSGLGGDAASTAASMLIDFISGFFDIDLSNDKKSKLGIFGKALGAGVSGDNVDNTPLPTMEKPTRVSNKANPSFATITGQLDDLIKTANKIGVYTKEQQEAILKQINQAKRVAKEQQLENKAPVVPELPEAGNSNDLGPLDTSVNSLIQRIDELSETVDGLANGGLGTGGMGGLPMDMSGGRRRRGAQPRERLVRSATSASGWAHGPNSTKPAGQFAKAPTPSWMGRATAAVSGTATRIAAPIAAGAASSKVAGLMTAGFRSTKRAGGSIKTAVRKAAGPIIGKALGRTVLKSIPIVGAGIGAAFAIGRLLQGDVVGAGVELGSGVAGPLTAVPALAASVTRDTYASVYGVQPEQDPNFKDRYKELKGEIDGLIKEQLSGVIKPMSTPTDREMGETETPTMRPQAAPVRQPPAVPSATTPAGATGGSPPAAATTATTGGGSGAAATGDATSTSGGGGAASQQMTPEPTTGMDLASPAMVTNATTGAQLTAQQMPVAASYESYGYNPTSGKFMPQTGNTTRGAAQGVGSIPSPVYFTEGLEAFMSTLYFDS